MDSKAAREDRLKAALRENLRKRKQRDAGPDSVEPPVAPPPGEGPA
jgi:hypothetical protein